MCPPLWHCRPGAHDTSGHLPDWYLAAGCLYQTVWNVLDGDPPERRILDYDVIYFDDGDLRCRAEDEVIVRCREAFADLPITVEVRKPSPGGSLRGPHRGAGAASSLQRGGQSTSTPPTPARWPFDRPTAATTCTRRTGSMMCSRSSLGPTRWSHLDFYESKAARWATLWPRLTVLPWPEILRLATCNVRSTDDRPEDRTVTVTLLRIT